MKPINMELIGLAFRNFSNYLTGNAIAQNALKSAREVREYCNDIIIVSNSKFMNEVQFRVNGAIVSEYYTERYLSLYNEIITSCLQQFKTHNIANIALSTAQTESKNSAEYIAILRKTKDEVQALIKNLDKTIKDHKDCLNDLKKNDYYRRETIKYCKNKTDVNKDNITFIEQSLNKCIEQHRLISIIANETIRLAEESKAMFSEVYRQFDKELNTQINLKSETKKSFEDTAILGKN